MAGCPKEIRSLKRRGYFGALKKAADAAIEVVGNRGTVPEALEALLEEMETGYQEQMFSFAWMKDIQIKDDFARFARIFGYLFSDGERVVDYKVRCKVKTALYDGIVETVVDLVLQRRSGVMVAVLLNLGAGKRGVRGRSLKTQSRGNPAAVVAKAGLEEEYPGIIIWDMYLTHPNDEPGNIVPDFFQSQAAESQLQILSYKEFYVNGEWDTEGFYLFAQQCFKEVPDPPCQFCKEAYLCKQGRVLLEPRYDQIIADPPISYQLPGFSEEQKMIVEHGEGAILVIAGPGSGKTAALVGRLRYLVHERRIPPEFILAITFTRKATEEIRERCRCFLEDGEEIHISTLNALGYSILMDHARKAGIEEYRLLTPADNLLLIENLLDSLAKPLQGFSYAQKEGKKGLLKTILRRLIRLRDDPEAFRKSEKDLKEDFYRFAESYAETLVAGNYIDYDQQISLCLRLLEEDEKLRKAYQNMYWYICVDEYQDIDEKQCRLIDLLAAGHGNLMAIGDDDQSIYAFRGGSPAYMLDFKNRYPNGKLFFLSRNFRNGAGIVSMAFGNIGKNPDRYDKEIVPVKGPGILPVISEGDTLWEQVRHHMDMLLAEGIEPEEIAVLSWKNSTLEEIYSSLPDLPLKLERELLCRSAFFSFLKDILILAEDLDNTEARKEYFSLFGLEDPGEHMFKTDYIRADCQFPYVELQNEECAYACLKYFCQYLLVQNTAAAFLEEGAAVAGYHTQPVYKQLSEWLETRHIDTVDAMKKEFLYMVRMEDDTRLETESPKQSILTTVHEAKGREWKAVIVLDDFGNKDTADIRRLIYVALTRAEERLIICKLPGDSLLT